MTRKTSVLSLNHFRNTTAGRKTEIQRSEISTAQGILGVKMKNQLMIAIYFHSTPVESAASALVDTHTTHPHTRTHTHTMNKFNPIYDVLKCG